MRERENAERDKPERKGENTKRNPRAACSSIPGRQSEPERDESAIQPAEHKRDVGSLAVRDARRIKGHERGEGTDPS